MLTMENQKLHNKDGPRESRSLNYRLRLPPSSLPSFMPTTKTGDEDSPTELEDKDSELEADVAELTSEKGELHNDERPREIEEPKPQSVLSKNMLVCLILVVVCAAIFYKAGESKRILQDLEEELAMVRRQLEGSKLEIKKLEQSCGDDVTKVNAAKGEVQAKLLQLMDSYRVLETSCWMRRINFRSWKSGAPMTGWRSTPRRHWTIYTKTSSKIIRTKRWKCTGYRRWRNTQTCRRPY